MTFTSKDTTDIYTATLEDNTQAKEQAAWQVAPQQSLLPFRFNNTKFKSVNYIYNLSEFPATFTEIASSP